MPSEMDTSTIERLPENQEICCGIMFPRNGREASPMVLVPKQDLNKDTNRHANMEGEISQGPIS